MGSTAVDYEGITLCASRIMRPAFNTLIADCGHEPDALSGSSCKRQTRDGTGSSRSRANRRGGASVVFSLGCRRTMKCRRRVTGRLPGWDAGWDAKLDAECWMDANRGAGPTTATAPRLVFRAQHCRSRCLTSRELQIVRPNCLRLRAAVRNARYRHRGGRISLSSSSASPKTCLVSVEQSVVLGANVSTG